MGDGVEGTDDPRRKRSISSPAGWGYHACAEVATKERSCSGIEVGRRCARTDVPMVVMEAAEISVIVYSAKSLPEKKKGRHKYSVVFGIGSNKFKTEVVSDQTGSPEWNEESAITVDSGHNPLILTVRDAHDPLGQISVPLSSLPGYRTNRTTKAALQPHRKCPNPQGELLYEAWVSKHGAALHHNHLSLDSDSDSGHKGGTFGRIKDTFRPHSPLAKRKSPIFGRKKINQTQEPEPGRLGRRRHSSLSDLTKLHEQWEKAGVKDHAIIHENGIKNLAFAPFALMAPLDNNKRTSSHVDLTRDELDKPSISGISPNQGPISGGTRITIRGRNLGVDKADVVGLHICGANCLGSLEYESASKLYVTTKAWKPVKGLITVVTQSGGKGSSLVEFTFIDPKVPLVNGAKPRLSRSNSVGDLKGSENDRKSGIFSWLTDSKDQKEVKIKDAEKLEKLRESLEAAYVEIKRLKDENKGLREENQTMKVYIDQLVMRVMEECPEALATGSTNNHNSATL